MLFGLSNSTEYVLNQAGYASGWSGGKWSLEIIKKGLKLIDNYGGMTMKSMRIKGMNCGHCVMAVTRALRAIEGIRDVDVDLSKGTATYEEDKPVPVDAIVAAIRKAGYDVVE